MEEKAKWKVGEEIMVEPVIMTPVEPVAVEPRKGELRRCPFCQSEAGLEHGESYLGGVWRVFCCDDSDEKCPIGLMSTIGYARRAEAVAAWNKRTTE